MSSTVRLPKTLATRLSAFIVILVGAAHGGALDKERHHFFLLATKVWD